MARRGERISLDTSDADGLSRPCDAPACAAAGAYRAPRDRRRLRDYYWFCLQHVREYNGAWDYYRGMGPGEIEAHLREDAGWQRPTWPLGRLGGAQRFDPEILRDPLGVLGGDGGNGAARAKKSAAPEAPPELRAALDVLGLDWPLEQTALRARYKELAKRHHPDANGGDRAAEERLKDINRAYSLLRHRVGPRPGAAPVPPEQPAAG